MKTSITTSITEGQKKQYKRFVEDAVDKALAETGLDKDGLQRVIENGDDLQSTIMAKLRELSAANRYADEEVGSSYGYFSGYKPKGITEQTNILRQLFPGIGFADEKIAQQPLPVNAEGWFAIPMWQTLAPTYGEAVQKVFAMIASKRKFYDYDGQLGAEYLRQHAKTAKMFQKLGEEQQKSHDILIVPAQFGFRHRGRSVRRVRVIMNSSEFGLGAFAVGVMLLTHPERLKHYDDLWIDCAGDEYSPNADGQFVYAPYFYFDGGRVKFNASWFDSNNGHYGSASAFLL